MKQFCIFIFVFLLTACDNKLGTEDLHYPVETTQAVLVDLYVASEAVKDVSDIMKDSLLDVYRSQIEKIHNIDFAIMENDIALIRSNDALYTEVHKVVNDSINFIDKAVQKIKSKDKIKSIPDKKSKQKPKAKKQLKKNR